MKKRVTKVTRSTRSATRWCLTLECGHEYWAVSRRRPMRAKVECTECTENARAYHGDIDGDLEGYDGP